MSSQLLVFAAFLTVAYGAVIGAPLQKPIIVEEAHAPAAYDFEYSINDPTTGDVKSQKENRQGDVVHGSYSLVEPDGSTRTVEYTADEEHGFNAVVHRTAGSEPIVKTVTPIKTVSAPVASYTQVAPQVVRTVAPVATVAHVAPTLQVSHAPLATFAHVSAPVAHLSAPVAHVAHVVPAASYPHVAAPVHVAHAPLATVAHVAPVAHVSAPIGQYSDASAVSYSTLSTQH